MLKPTAGNLIAKRVEAQTTSPGGLIIQSAAATDPTRAQVVAVQHEGDEMPFLAGDEIIFIRGAGQQVKHEGQDYLILRVKDVLAVA